MIAIEAQGLTKIFDQSKRAVDGIGLSIEQGEVFGFLGPNGAGKTTTVKLLNGMLDASGGSCRVLGIDPAAQPAELHRHCGVVTEHAQMYDHMTGLRNLLFYGGLFGMKDAECESRARELLQRLELEDAADKKLGSYSTGMRQRLSLARAMIHRPSMLFLDEPTSGLDPESAQNVNNMIKSLANDEGTTIFLCTHQLRYAQEICTSYGLIDRGEMLASGDIERLRGMVFSGVKVLIEAGNLPGGLPERLALQQEEGRRWSMRVQAEEEIPGIVRAIVEAGGDVYGVTAQRLTLEEIYFALIDRKEGGA